MYTGRLRENCARSMKLKMMVSSCRMSELRMFARHSVELMSSADAVAAAAASTVAGAEAAANTPGARRCCTWLRQGADAVFR